MPVLFILLKIVSATSLCVTFHYVYTAAFKPEFFVQRNIKRNPSPFEWLYLSLVIIGLATFLFAGTNTLLFGIPSNWSINRNGDLLPIRLGISVASAFFAFPLLSILDTYANNKLTVISLRERIASLELMSKQNSRA